MYVRRNLTYVTPYVSRTFFDYPCLRRLVHAEPLLEDSYRRFCLFHFLPAVIALFRDYVQFGHPYVSIHFLSFALFFFCFFSCFDGLVISLFTIREFLLALLLNLTRNSVPDYEGNIKRD